MLNCSMISLVFWCSSCSRLSNSIFCSLVFLALSSKSLSRGGLQGRCVLPPELLVLLQQLGVLGLQLLQGGRA